MINTTYKDMLNTKSVIRSIGERASARRAQIGEENVFDFSLGNPSVPCPPSFTTNMIDMYENESPHTLHGYSPSVGIASVREAIADSLNRRFGMQYRADHIFPTSGATAALAHAFRALTKPGEEIITFAPFFPEYIPYVSATGAHLTVIDADLEHFQIDFTKFEQALNETTAAVLINTPNNPSGVVYSEETLQKLAQMLEEKQREYGHDIFLISDEPYREIVFDGKSQPYPARYYRNTVTCYSFSKSLSVPGERIGYVAVNPHATDADVLVPMFAQISRTIGHNCPSSSIQLDVARVIDDTSDVSIYETNMNLLYDALVRLGFEVERPGGTFYMFPKALEEDATAFCTKAMDYDLYIVPSDSFGVSGYVRFAFCVPTEKLQRAIERLEQFVHEQYSR